MGGKGKVRKTIGREERGEKEKSERAAGRVSHVVGK